METLNLISHETVYIIGWTIIHSLWQGLLISLVLALVLMFVKKNNPRIRTLFAFSALIILFAFSIRTYIVLENGNNEKTNVEKISERLNTSSKLTNNSNISESQVIAAKQSSKYSNYISSFNKFLSENIQTVVLFWFIGVLVLSIRLLGGVFYTQRLKSREVIPVNKYWENSLKQLIDKLEISKNVTLVQSKLITVPVTIGNFKPIILLPLGLISGIPQNQLEIILAHELAHIKQADYLINILQSIIEVFFFFNPAVWWISKTIRKEREYSCDDLAIEACGNSITLAKALLFVKKSEQLEATIAMASIRDNNSLMGRIKRMTNKTEKKQYGSVFAIIPALLFVFIFAFASSEHLGKNENLSVIGIAQPVVGASLASVGDDDRNQFSFRENNIKWKAYFEKGKLVELYKNGEKIPKEQFAKYEDLIYKRYAEFEVEMAELEIDMKQLKVELEDLKNIKIDFDNEEFMEEMKTMKHELSRELSKLKDLDFNINIDIDLDELNESLKNIKVDLSGFDEEMADLKIELTGLKKELRVLKRFMHNLKEGLVDDGYLEDDADDFDLDLSREEMILNGKQLPESTHRKYLKLYKEHFGEELEDEFRISN